MAGDEVSEVSRYLPEKGARYSSRSGIGEYQRNAPGPFCCSVALLPALTRSPADPAWLFTL